MDKKLFLAMYNFSQKRKGMNSFWLFIANYSSHIFFTIYTVTGLRVLWRQPGRMIPYIAVPFLCYLAVKTLRAALRRPRPFSAFDLPVVTKHPKAYSCPSNHAASSVIIALACLYINGMLGSILLILSLFTGLSRVFVGLHYPADIILGWFLAASFGMLYILV